MFKISTLIMSMVYHELVVVDPFQPKEVTPGDLARIPIVKVHNAARYRAMIVPCLIADHPCPANNADV